MRMLTMPVLLVLLMLPGCGDDDPGTAADGALASGDASAGDGAAPGPDAAANQLPVATIDHPGNGETRPASSDIPFVGRAVDPQDGALTGAALVWTSNLDGQLGTGTSFTRRLSAGSNVVTLTARDSAGNTGTTSITLTITP